MKNIKKKLKKKKIYYFLLETKNDLKRDRQANLDDVNEFWKEI